MLLSLVYTIFYTNMPQRRESAAEIGILRGRQD
jgi:hypothetical protein